MNKTPNKNEKDPLSSFRCIECNENDEKTSDLICKNCHNIVDPYFRMEKGVIFIDLILCKNQAYRHLTFNRFITHRRRAILMLLTIYIFLDIIFELYVKRYSEYDNVPYILNDSCNYQDHVSEILEIKHRFRKCFIYSSSSFYFALLGLSKFGSYIFEILILHFYLSLFYSNIMKKKKITVSLLYFALLLGHFGKTIHVLYIIWGYSNHFIILGSIFLRITIIASVRGILERHNFILPILIVLISYLTKTFIISFIHNNFVIQFNLLENYFIDL